MKNRQTINKETTLSKSEERNKKAINESIERQEGNKESNKLTKTKGWKKGTREI